MADAETPPDDDERNRSRQAVREYLVQHSHGKLGNPSPVLVGRILQAAGGETIASYHRIRDSLIDLQRSSSSTPSGWGWYVAVLTPMLGQPLEIAGKGMPG